MHQPDKCGRDSSSGKLTAVSTVVYCIKKFDSSPTLTARAGLVAVAELIRHLRLPSMIDRRLPRRDSNRAIHPASFSKASLIVEVPRQRNCRKDHATVKSGEVPKERKGQPNKLRQKDTDARWTKKRGQSCYGYKNHVSVDRDTKLIDRYEVTASSRHNSRYSGSFCPTVRLGTLRFGRTVRIARRMGLKSCANAVSSCASITRGCARKS